MKIAITANLFKEIASNSAGGTELFTYLLTNELATRSEITTITIYAAGKNHFDHPKIKFVNVFEKTVNSFIGTNPLLKSVSLNRPSFPEEIHCNLIVKTCQLLNGEHYDIIHNNSTSSIFHSLLSQYNSHLNNTPIITTLHTNISSPSVIIPYFLNYFKNKSNFYIVPIAQHQIKNVKQHNQLLPLVSPIYNGINANMFPLQENTIPNGSGLWIGRISQKHNKGLKEAIIASNKINTPLCVVAYVEDEYFYQHEISPEINNNIDITLSEITLSKKIELYQKSSFLLYPVMWEEPFGLIFLEAMSTGTPVIAFARGAAPEIIKDGETGYLVNPANNDIRGNYCIKKTGIDGLCEAIKRIHSLPIGLYQKMRVACSKHVTNNFTIKKMVDRYINLYSSVLFNN